MFSAPTLVLTLVGLVTCLSSAAQSQLQVANCETPIPVYFKYGTDSLTTDGFIIYLGQYGRDAAAILISWRDHLIDQDTTCLTLRAAIEAHEDPSLGRARLERIANMLVALGISRDRLILADDGATFPVLTEQDLAKIPANERDLARSLNCRLDFRPCVCPP
jgi:hypothetical protein